MVRMFASVKSRTSLEMCHVGIETRSPGQIIEKSCVHFRGQILGLILMKIGKNVCLDDISDEFENGLC